MKGIYKIKFIRYLKEVGLYAQFVKNINATRDNIFEHGLGFEIAGLKKSTISSYLDAVGGMSGLAYAFKWCQTAEGDLIWRTCHEFWVSVIDLPIDEFQRKIASFNLEEKIKLANEELFA